VIKEIQVTLYEAFGYVIPGFVLTAALAVAFFAIYLPCTAVTFDLKTTEVWLTFIALSYFAGHVVQALGNVLVKWWKWDAEQVVASLPQEIREAVSEKLKEKLGDKAGGVTGRWMYELCDDAVLRSGKLGEREVYVYREGFYRGMFVGFLIMALALGGMAIRLLCEPDHTFMLGSWAIKPNQLVFFVVISVAWSVLALRRYWRFVDYRVRHSVLGFLSISAKDKDDKKEKPNDAGP
jgi:hypothetical protein